MLNESASAHSQQSPVDFSLFEDDFLEQSASDDHIELQEIVASVMSIEKVTFYPSGDESIFAKGIVLPGQQSGLIATFEGRLLIGSEKAYDQLDALLEPKNQMPVFREDIRKVERFDKTVHVIHILDHRIQASVRPWWPNLLLFIATFLSVIVTGALQSGEIASIEALTSDLTLLRHGLPYGLGLMTIIVAHEFGHYWAARRHNLNVTLPYFIPLPFGLFGTLGAFIQLREPMRNRKVLMEVGAAGPLAGLIFALPILIVGLLLSEVMPIPTNEPTFTEGNSILYLLTKLIIFGRILPSGGEDVFIHPLAFAGWVGLLITSLNLIPVGQLDGGHILYSLIGHRAKALYYPILIALFLLAVTVSPLWFLWVALLFLFGQVHAVPLDAITKLDPRRRLISIVSLVIFVLIFMPIPFSFNNPQTDGTPPRRDRNTIENNYQPTLLANESFNGVTIVE